MVEYLRTVWIGLCWPIFSSPDQHRGSVGLTNRCVHRGAMQRAVVRRTPRSGNVPLWFILLGCFHDFEEAGHCGRMVNIGE